jgi:hypothetical protein
MCVCAHVHLENEAVCVITEWCKTVIGCGLGHKFSDRGKIAPFTVLNTGLFKSTMFILSTPVFRYQSKLWLSCRLVCKVLISVNTCYCQYPVFAIDWTCQVKTYLPQHQWLNVITDFCHKSLLNFMLKTLNWEWRFYILTFRVIQDTTVLECRYYFIASFVIYMSQWTRVSNLFHLLTSYMVSF